MGVYELIYSTINRFLDFIWILKNHFMIDKQNIYLAVPASECKNGDRVPVTLPTGTVPNNAMNCSGKSRVFL